MAGGATWTGSLHGVDLGQGAKLPPVFGLATLQIELTTLEGTARFDDLTVLEDATAKPFRQASLQYPVTVADNAFANGTGTIHGRFFGPDHDEMAGIFDDHDPGVNLPARFGGKR